MAETAAWSTLKCNWWWLHTVMGFQLLELEKAKLL